MLMGTGSSAFNHEIFWSINKLNKINRKKRNESK